MYLQFIYCYFITGVHYSYMKETRPLYIQSYNRRSDGVKELMGSVRQGIDTKKYNRFLCNLLLNMKSNNSKVNIT